jgi:hypothetical protein
MDGRLVAEGIQLTTKEDILAVAFNDVLDLLTYCAEVEDFLCAQK